MTQDEAFFVLGEKKWEAESSLRGIWAVGPPTHDGTLVVLGMAPTLEEAVEMALRSIAESA